MGVYDFRAPFAAYECPMELFEQSCRGEMWVVAPSVMIHASASPPQCRLHGAWGGAGTTSCRLYVPHSAGDLDLTLAELLAVFYGAPRPDKSQEVATPQEQPRQMSADWAHSLHSSALFCTLAASCTPCMFPLYND